MADPGTVAGVVLASGLSRRFGDDNKLLLPVRGEPLVRRVARAYVEAELAEVLVVVGHEADRVADALGELKVRLVHNPDFAAGQSRALVRGVSSLGPDVGAAILGVADQPYLDSAVVSTLAAEWQRHRPLVIAPRYDGQRGNPVLFDRALFQELLKVTGDRGGRDVFERHAEWAVFIDFGASPGADIDTPDDYARLG